MVARARRRCPRRCPPSARRRRARRARRGLDRGDQLDVDRALGGARGEVLVGDVAVVLAGADDAGGHVVGLAGSPGSRARRSGRGRRAGPRAARSPLRWAMRRTRSGGAVPSRCTCSSALGISATVTPSTSRTAGSGRRRGRRSVGAGQRVGGARGGVRVARVDQRQRVALADALAGRGDLGEADGVVDRVVLAAAAAAEVDDGQADRADVDGGRRRRGASGGAATVTGAAARWSPGRSSRSAGPAERAHHAGEALGRRRPSQRLPRAVGVAVEPAEAQHRARPARASPRAGAVVARGAGEVVDRLAHLDARCPRCARGRGPCR